MRKTAAESWVLESNPKLSRGKQPNRRNTSAIAIATSEWPAADVTARAAVEIAPVWKTVLFVRTAYLNDLETVLMLVCLSVTKNNNLL